jgi:hypothetical protein
MSAIPPHAAAALPLLLILAACDARPPARAAGDTAYAAMQERGRTAMGVDQYTSTHHFDELPDGGRIVLERDSNDSAGVAQIRAHLRAEARAFAAGDFDRPTFVHAHRVPGADVMSNRRSVITYSVSDLDRGAALRITTTDSAALTAVHEFLRYQRTEHGHRSSDR